MNIEEQKKLLTMQRTTRSQLRETEDETAKAVKAWDRTRESAYGESKQERTMEDQPHQHCPTGDDG